MKPAVGNVSGDRAGLRRYVRGNDPRFTRARVARAGRIGMTSTPRKGSLGNRLAMWRALRAAPVTGFVSQPEPRSIGLYARGKQLVAGNFQFAGEVVEAAGKVIWDVVPSDPSLAVEAQGFVWLDDLAAVGDLAARGRAQAWTWEWIARFGRGKGAGWTPDLTGRRLLRWINHALFLLSGRDRAQTEAYYRSLSAQVVFLTRRWPEAAAGLPRFEALTGLISAGLALTGMEARIVPAVAALADECAREVDAQGGIPTRNPEELLEVFTLLTWAEQALSEAGRIPPQALVEALERMGGAGGGRGGARGGAGQAAHASTAAFELTSGRRPLIVSCGSGAPFGAEWRRAGRATASHSTLAVEGFSSSRLAAGEGREVLTDRAEVTALRQSVFPEGAHLYLCHSGWSATHGLSHSRDLLLASDGRKLTGIDTLAAQTPAERARFERLMTDGRLEGVGIALRFHLHPDVDAALDMGGTAVSLALKSGEIWVFRHDGHAKLSLDPSVYLEKTRLKPRPARQIVLSTRAMGLETQIGWTLAKAQDTPLAIRDLDRDDMPVPI